MIRRIIHIDEEKCNGCGLCANACHEGAIDIVDGKAKLMREHFCDGLGDCLPACPMDAISFEEREAPEYNEAAVMAAKAGKAAQSEPFAGCPSSAPKVVIPTAGVMPSSGEIRPELTNWPVQIKLAPTRAPYFDGAKLLIAADCTAYSYAAFHRDFIKGRVALIGCPKLDAIDYSEKLTEIIRNNDIKDVTIVRMEVPCCGGLEMAAKNALQASGKFLPWSVVTVGIDGSLM